MSLFGIVRASSSALLEKFRAFWETSLYRNATYLMIGNGAGALLGFVFWAAAARSYSAEAVGLGSAVIASLQLLAMLSNLGLEIGIVRFLPGSADRAVGMINSSFTISLVASLAVSSVFVLGISVWSPNLVFLRQNATYFILFTMFTAATSISTILDSSFIAKRRAGFATVRMTIFNVLKLVLAVLLARTVESQGLTNSWGIGSIISVFIGLFFFLPRIQLRYFPRLSFKRRDTTELLRYSIVNFIAKLVWYLPAGILPIVVLRILGEKMNAYFYIAWTVASTLSLIATSVSSSLLAEGSYDENDVVPQAMRGLELALLMLLPIAILAVFFSRPLLSAFGADYVSNADRLFQLLVVGLIPATVNQVYSGALRVQKRLISLTVLGTLISVSTMLLSYWLLPVMGIIGVGIGWLVSQTLAATWILMSRRWGKLLFEHLGWQLGRLPSREKKRTAK